VSSIKYQCGWINIWSVPCISTNFELPIFAYIYEHIWYEKAFIFFCFWLTVSIYVCAIFSFPSYIVGTLSKLTETSFFCWRLHKYELLQFVWCFFLFIITSRTSIQCHIYISVYLDYWSLAYQWFFICTPPSLFSFWNITVLWSNTTQIVITDICVIFSRRTMFLSICSMVQLYS
jgi:hypothetical protein